MEFFHLPNVLPGIAETDRNADSDIERTSPSEVATKCSPV
jgi:hypothetical protein